jgi:hypothetical protein
MKLNALRVRCHNGSVALAELQPSAAFDPAIRRSTRQPEKPAEATCNTRALQRTKPRFSLNDN